MGSAVVSEEDEGFPDEEGETAYLQLRILRTLSPDQAWRLVMLIRKAVLDRGLSGCIRVTDSTGFNLVLLATGEEPNIRHSNVGNSQIRTVIGVRRSTRVIKEEMQDRRLRPADFGPSVVGLTIGGVAIFADPELREFIGAVSFVSGTNDWVNEAICVEAVTQIGLYTDLISQN